MTRVVVDNSPIELVVSEDTYSVVTEDNRVNIQVRDVIIGEGAPVQEEEMYDLEIDTSVSGATYVGQALPGTAKSESAWRIKKITETETGSSVDWASGTSGFVHVWNNRLSYTYGP